MSIRPLAALILMALPSQYARAQDTASIDSVVTDFLEHGAQSFWGPWRLFEGCPNLSDAQNHGIERLMASERSVRITNDLARSWSFMIEECDDPRLNEWYVEQMDAAIARGDFERMDALRNAVYDSDTPRLREYAYRQMMDPSLEGAIRARAGVGYFGRFEGDELLREFLAAFETMQLPWGIAWSQATRALRYDADRLLAEVARLVRENPALADQTAFTQIVTSSPRHASPAARARLADALEEGIARNSATVTGRHRERLESAVRHLRN